MTAKSQTIHRALNLQNRKERWLKNLKKQTRLGCHFPLLSKQNNALSPVSVVNCETLSPICRSNYSQSFTGIMSNDWSAWSCNRQGLLGLFKWQMQPQVQTLLHHGVPCTLRETRLHPYTQLAKARGEALLMYCDPIPDHISQLSLWCLHPIVDWTTVSRSSGRDV